MSTTPPQQTAAAFDNERWQAVARRDPHFDGVFVFAVQTTGIYCRPSCPAPRPRPENVRYYALPEAAESAGFRPCKRCQPQLQPAVDPQVEVVRQVCAFIRQHETAPTLAQIGAAVHISPYHLQRLFKRVMGVSPREYADAARVEALKARLRDGDTVTGALYEAGYGSSSRLYTQAASQLGMTPGIYKKGGEGMRITYSVHPCALGLALVGVTEYGVCAVYLGDSEPELAHTLRSEYPRAHIQHDPAHMSQWVQAVIQHLDGWQPHLDLPLDLQATAFQRRVWQELQRIPPGETRTYAQIAAALGDPQAARAVAGACASNRLAVIIPCHRVVRSDGTLGGYRWGLARKTALLAREKAHQPAPQIP